MTALQYNPMLTGTANSVVIHHRPCQRETGTSTSAPKQNPGQKTIPASPGIHAPSPFSTANHSVLAALDAAPSPPSSTEVRKARPQNRS